MNTCKNINCYYCIEDKCKRQSIRLNIKGICKSYLSRRSMMKKLHEETKKTITATIKFEVASEEEFERLKEAGQLPNETWELLQEKKI